MSFTRWFTLVEIIIVVSIISILAAAIFPFAQSYLARARDVNRVTDIRSLAGVFQVYRNVNETLPDNTIGSGTYCTSTILSWSNWVWRDRQYEELSKNFVLVPNEKIIRTPISPCSQTGSYIYNRLIDATANQYGVVAAQLETNSNTTYLTGTDFILTTKISAILQAQKINWVDVNTLSWWLSSMYHLVVY